MDTRRKNNVIVSVGVFNRQGRFLMVEEGKERIKGLWSMPSGRLELGETIIEGAIRETLEETGCKVEIDGLCGVFHYQLEDKHEMSVRFCFYGKLISQDKDAVLEKDVLSCAWKTRKEIDEMIKSGKIRSKMADKIIQYYFSGKRYLLETINEL